MKRVSLLAWVLITVGLIWVVRDRFPRIEIVEEIVILPAVPETIRVNLPGETDTIFVVERDTINTVITRTVFDTVRIACQNLEQQRRLISLVFGSARGDTLLALSETMSFENDSLTSQQTTERIYMLGMPRRIGTDSEGTTVQWQEFPVTTVNSCSIWNRIAHLTIGVGGGIIIGEVF